MLNGIINQIYNALLMNIDTIQTHAMTQNNLTDATNQLQQNWSSRTRGNDDLDKAIELALYGDGTKEHPGIVNMPAGSDTEKKAKLTAISDFINTYMILQKGAKSPYTQSQLLSHWSSQEVAEIQGQVNSCYDKDNGPPIMGLLSSMSSMVQAESTQELSPLQSLVKSEGSVIQKDGDAQQPLADAGNSFITLFGSAATFLQQSYF